MKRILLLVLALGGCAPSLVEEYRGALQRDEAQYQEAVAQCPSYDTVCRAQHAKTHEEVVESLGRQLETLTRARQSMAAQTLMNTQNARIWGDAAGSLGQAIGDSLSNNVIVYPKGGGGLTCYQSRGLPYQTTSCY